MFSFLTAPAGIGADPVPVDGHDLSGTHVANELCPDSVQRAGFGRKHGFSVFRFSVTKRSESVRIPRRDQFLRGADHQRVGSFDDSHCGINRLFNRFMVQTLLHDDIGDHFRIRRGVKDGAPAFEHRPEFIGIGKIAVMAQRHPAFAVIHDQRLDILKELRAGRGITDMTYGDIAGAEGPKRFRMEDLADKAFSLGIGENAVIIHGDAGAFLPAVLQGKKSVIRH